MQLVYRVVSAITYTLKIWENFNVSVGALYSDFMVDKSEADRLNERLPDTEDRVHCALLLSEKKTFLICKIWKSVHLLEKMRTDT